jgi:hypothetical protein
MVDEKHIKFKVRNCNFKYHSGDWEEEFPLVTSSENKPNCSGVTPRGGGRSSFMNK